MLGISHQASASRPRRAPVEAVVATDAWVIDGSYQSKLGDFVFRHADVVVWLDQPMRVWLPRLVGRTFARVIRREVAKRPCTGRKRPRRARSRIRTREIVASTI